MDRDKASRKEWCGVKRLVTVEAITTHPWAEPEGTKEGMEFTKAPWELSTEGL